jgi:hypothetical protein
VVPDVGPEFKPQYSKKKKKEKKKLLPLSPQKMSAKHNDLDSLKV